jgi:hypothetical protein
LVGEFPRSQFRIVDHDAFLVFACENLFELRRDDMSG